LNTLKGTPVQRGELNEWWCTTRHCSDSGLSGVCGRGQGKGWWGWPSATACVALRCSLWAITKRFVTTKIYEKAISRAGLAASPVSFYPVRSRQKTLLRQESVLPDMQGAGW